MNLENLFQTQKVLRDRIGYNEPDRFNKLILALLVELGELANEQRSWKFWSKDQTPRTRKARGPYVDLEDAEFYNPLLEEYVDGLHFILEIGLEINYTDIVVDSDYTEETTEETFIKLYKEIAKIPDAEVPEEEYEMIFNLYVGLAEKHLCFTWEEVEQAYFAKNKINHHRQEVGY